MRCRKIICATPPWGGMVGVVDGERREDASKLISLIASKRSRNSG